MATFRKPKRGTAPVVTCTLHVAGLGDRLGHTSKVVAAMVSEVLLRRPPRVDASELVEVGEVQLVPGASYVFLIFGSEAAATVAREALDGQEARDPTCDRPHGATPRATPPLCPASPAAAVAQGKRRVLRPTFAERRPAAASGHDELACTSTFSEAPAGLELLDDFIGPDEEAALLRWAEAGAWDRSLARRVQHFGYTFNYGLRAVDFGAATPALPTQLLDLARRIEVAAGLPASEESYFNQVTVNEYAPGQGIASHVDTHGAFAEALASVSLGAGVVMDFRPSGPRAATKECGGVALRRTGLLPQCPAADGGAVTGAGPGSSGSRRDLAPPLATEEGRGGDPGRKRGAGAALCGEGARGGAGEATGATATNGDRHGTDRNVTDGGQQPAPGARHLRWLSPRSVLVLRGASRYAWAHGIAPRKADKVAGLVVPREATRVSITFRRALLPGDLCHCGCGEPTPG
jgi:alkylated DNA repair dioxygenase AlkB